MRGVLHEALEYPEFPQVMRPILNMFNDLSGTSFQEIKAYKDVTGVDVDLFDINLIKDIEYTKNLIATGRDVKKVMEAFGYGDH